MLIHMTSNSEVLTVMRRIYKRQKSFPTLDVEYHNIVNDMMLTKMITYKPNLSAEGGLLRI